MIDYSYKVRPWNNETVKFIKDQTGLHNSFSVEGQCTKMYCIKDFIFFVTANFLNVLFFCMVSNAMGSSALKYWQTSTVEDKHWGNNNLNNLYLCDINEKKATTTKKDKTSNHH